MSGPLRIVGIKYHWIGPHELKENANSSFDYFQELVGPKKMGYIGVVRLAGKVEFFAIAYGTSAPVDSTWCMRFNIPFEDSMCPIDKISRPKKCYEYMKKLAVDNNVKYEEHGIWPYKILQNKEKTVESGLNGKSPAVQLRIKRKAFLITTTESLQDMSKNESLEDMSTNDSQEAVERTEIQEDMSTKDSQEEVEMTESQEEVPTKDSQEEVPTKDSQEEVPTEDSQEEVPTEDSQEEVPTKDSHEEVPTKDSQEAVETKDSQESVETNDSQEAVEITESAEVVATKESLEAVATKLRIDLRSKLEQRINKSNETSDSDVESSAMARKSTGDQMNPAGGAVEKQSEILGPSLKKVKVNPTKTTHAALKKIFLHGGTGVKRHECQSFIVKRKNAFKMSAPVNYVEAEQRLREYIKHTHEGSDPERTTKKTILMAFKHDEDPSAGGSQTNTEQMEQYYSCTLSRDLSLGVYAGAGQSDLKFSTPERIVIIAKCRPENIQEWTDWDFRHVSELDIS